MKRIAIVTAIMIMSASAFAQDTKPGATPATPASPASPASPATPADPAKQEGKATGHHKKMAKKGHDKRHDKGHEMSHEKQEKHEKGMHSEAREHDIPSADSKGKGGGSK